MKKIALIAAAALLSLAASAQDFKLGYVDFTELMQLMPEMDSARVQIDAASLEAQETYQAMVEEYQSKAQQYEQKQSSWTPAIAQSKANELQQIMTRIQEFEQAIQQDFRTHTFHTEFALFRCFVLSALLAIYIRNICVLYISVCRFLFNKIPYGLKERFVIMALINCPYCGNRVSSLAPGCIYCGSNVGDSDEELMYEIRNKTLIKYQSSIRRIISK